MHKLGKTMLAGVAIASLWSCSSTNSSTDSSSRVLTAAEAVDLYNVQKATYRNTMRSRGYTQSAQTSGFLELGEVETMELSGIKKGERIVIAGIGDGDVIDLDIALIGPNGNLIGKDIQDDNLPIVARVAPRTGTYKVQIKLYKSRQNSAALYTVYCHEKN